jgi:hypothetical protein
VVGRHYPLTFIQRIAWKGNSTKYACRILHAPVLHDQNQPIGPLGHLSTILNDVVLHKDAMQRTGRSV